MGQLFCRIQLDIMLDSDYNQQGTYQEILIGVM